MEILTIFGTLILPLASVDESLSEESSPSLFFFLDELNLSSEKEEERPPSLPASGAKTAVFRCF